MGVLHPIQHPVSVRPSQAAQKQSKKKVNFFHPMSPAVGTRRYPAPEHGGSIQHHDDDE